jgi:hypothetical protein
VIKGVKTLQVDAVGREARLACPCDTCNGQLDWEMMDFVVDEYSMTRRDDITIQEIFEKLVISFSDKIVAYADVKRIISNAVDELWFYKTRACGVCDDCFLEAECFCCNIATFYTFPRSWNRPITPRMTRNENFHVQLLAETFLPAIADFLEVDLSKDEETFDACKRFKAENAHRWVILAQPRWDVFGPRYDVKEMYSQKHQIYRIVKLFER